MNDIIGQLQERNFKVHVVASGAGSNVQHEFWKIPGASSWLSGASFPYDQDETEEFIGFKPDSFCHPNTALHLAMIAYMKAYRYGCKAVGLGLSASVASLKQHRGDHRVHACVITPEQCFSVTRILAKGVGFEQRRCDNDACTSVAMNLIERSLGIESEFQSIDAIHEIKSSELLSEILKRPVFHESGARSADLPVRCALMPGAYNPPHAGHFNMAQAVQEIYGYRVVHQVTIDPPHKQSLTAQQVLERAKTLRGHSSIFTSGDPLYVQKAERFPGVPLIMGADALQRMLDPKWGIDPKSIIDKFRELKTQVFVFDRTENEKLLTLNEILCETGLSNVDDRPFTRLPGLWDISSTEIRNATLSHR